MRKLSEEEEDVHLDQDQIDQESSEIHSVDYDVWIDEKTGYKKVEKYMSYQHAEECPECGFTTMKILNEEIEQKPTATETGLLLKHYLCSYCRHREAREVVIAKLSTNVK
jgi:ribosomal protein L32